MKSITFGFSRSSQGLIGSKLIMWFMRKPFSHTYFKYKEDRYVDSTIFQATGKGLNYMAEHRFHEHNTPVREFTEQISDELFDELMRDCHNNAGIDYGFLQNLGLAFVRLADKVGWKIDKNPINDGINCSEWMYYILAEIYGPRWTETEPNLVAPDEVYEFLESKGLT